LRAKRERIELNSPLIIEQENVIAVLT